MIEKVPQAAAAAVVFYVAFAEFAAVTDVAAFAVASVADSVPRLLLYFIVGFREPLR